MRINGAITYACSEHNPIFAIDLCREQLEFGYIPSAQNRRRLGDMDVVIAGDLQQMPDVLFQQGTIAHGVIRSGGFADGIPAS